MVNQQGLAKFDQHRLNFIAVGYINHGEKHAAIFLQQLNECKEKNKLNFNEIKNGETPLIAALIQNNFPVAEKLVEFGASCQAILDFVIERRLEDALKILPVALQLPAFKQLDCLPILAFHNKRELLFAALANGVPMRTDIELKDKKDNSTLKKFLEIQKIVNRS